MLLKGEQQITTQQDRKAAPTLLPFSKHPCFSPLYWTEKGQEGQKSAGRKQKN